MKNICSWRRLFAALGVVWVVGVGVLWWCNCGIDTENTIFTFLKAQSTSKTSPGNLPGGRTVKKKVVCYYALPSASSTGPSLPVKDLDASLCTHIVISGAQVINNSIVPLHQDDLKVYSDVIALKQHVPGLQVLLSLHHGLSTLAQDTLDVSVFAYNARRFLARHGFDGLNIDWEGLGHSPDIVRNTATNTSKEVHYLFLQLNNALKLASHPPMMLTALVGPSKDVVDQLYSTEQLAGLVDYVSVGCYYFHFFTDLLPFTGHNSPLKASQRERGYWGTLNLQWATRRWLQTGMPRDKLIIGIPTFGMSWKLETSQSNRVGSLAVGRGMFGGTVSYPQACTFQQEGATRYNDVPRRAIYATRGTDWLSYEDPSTIKDKVEWGVSEGVAGVMIQNLNSDDWLEMCGEGSYPLLRAARNALTH